MGVSFCHMDRATIIITESLHHFLRALRWPKKIKTKQKQPPTQTSGTETVQKKKSPYNP